MERGKGIILKYDRHLGMLTIENEEGSGVKVFGKQVIGVNYDLLHNSPKDNAFEVRLFTTGGIFDLPYTYSKNDVDKIVNFIHEATSPNHSGDMNFELFIEN